MAALPKEMNERYDAEAEAHANFLCNHVFKPAFVMAFTHGAKHMYEELTTVAFHTEVAVSLDETEIHRSLDETMEILHEEWNNFDITSKADLIALLRGQLAAALSVQEEDKNAT